MYNVRLTFNEQDQYPEVILNISTYCINDCAMCFTNELKEIKLEEENRFDENGNPNLFQLDEEIEQKISDCLNQKETCEIESVNYDSCKAIIIKIISSHWNIKIITRNKFEFIYSICNDLIDYRENIQFSFLLGSLQPDKLDECTPNLEGRITCLKYAFFKGYSTCAIQEESLNIDESDLMEMILFYITDTVE